MIDLNKVDLYDLYHNQKLTLRQIGKELGVNGTTILYHLKKRNIPRRVNINDNKCIDCKKRINSRSKRCIICERKRRKPKENRCRKCNKVVSSYVIHCKKCHYEEFKFT